MIEEAVTATWVRFIPLAPLLAAMLHAVMIGLLRRSLSSLAAAIVTLGSVAAALLFSVLGFAELIGPAGNEAIVDRLGTWIGAGVGPGRVVVDWAFRLDPLAAVMCLMVSGVGLVSLVYAVGEMRGDTRDDRGEQRFFAFASLAIAAMLVLVLADDAVLLVAAWSVLGVATWWLLGFWYGDDANARPAMVAFVIGRLGDAALIGAFGLLFRVLGRQGGIPVGLDGLRAAQPEIASAVIDWPGVLGGGTVAVPEVACLLVLFAIATKAAQLPLSGWLSETVTAPTPALVLVHTVLTVAAPIYVGARLGFLFADAPIAAAVAAWVGGVTALFGALVACAQVDVFRVLAWSTASQMGYALVALAVAAPSAAIFQLLAHAFHKGLLFMAMGVAVAAIGGDRDMRHMGNLGTRLWRTRIDTWVAVLSMVGVLPLTTGFFSLEQVIVAVGVGDAVVGQSLLAWVVLLAVSATGFGIFRLVYASLYGETRIATNIRWEEIDDPGSWILWPMGALAVLAVGGALIGMPQNWADLLFADVDQANSLRHFLTPSADLAAVDVSVDAAAAAASLQWSFAGRTVAMALLGVLSAVWLYVYRPAWLDAINARLGWLQRGLVRGFGAGPALIGVMGRPALWVAERVLARRVEGALVEAATLRGSAQVVQHVANGWVRRLQSGSALRYVATTVVATVLVILYLLNASRG